MGFAFTNKQPPVATNTANAFNPLPSLPSAIRHPRNAQGPTVNSENSGPPATRPPVTFGIRTTATPKHSATENSDALSFFLNSKVPTKRQVWDIKDDFDAGKQRSKFTCYCTRTVEIRVEYQPSTAAHTIQKFAMREPNSNDSLRPFRFLDLPPEMRNRVYEATISPGHISLRSCATHHMSVGIEPPLTTGILAASKQLAHESKDMMFESTIIVDVSLESSTRSIINPLQLPRHLLPKIKHIVLVLDFTRVHDMNPSRTDWRPVQRMTGLRSMRICAIQMWPPAAFFRSERTLQDHHRETIKTVLECIPKTCVVEYGWSSEAEEEHVKEMHYRITLLPSSQRQSFSRAEIADAAELAAAAKEVKEETKKGWRNGIDRDFR